MAVGDETIGYGSTLEINDGGAGAYVAVGKIEILGIPSKIVGTVQSKRLDLTNRVIKKLPTLVDPGNFTFRVQHTNAMYSRLKTIRDAHTDYHFRATIADDDGDTVITVPGLLVQVKPDDVDAEKITVLECTVEVSGDDV